MVPCLKLSNCLYNKSLILMLRPMLSRTFLIGGIVLYALSLFLPAFYEQGHVGMPGLNVLLMGFIAVFMGVFAWFANFIMLAALIVSSRKSYKVSVGISGVAVLLGLQSVMVIGQNLCADSCAVITSLGEGFYVWEGSLVLFFIYFLLLLNSTRSTGVFRKK